MKNQSFNKTFAALLIAFTFAVTALAQTKSPTVGTYTGIWVSNFKPYSYDLTISGNGKYSQNDEAGTFSFDATSGKIEFLSGAMPKQWVGFFYKAGDQFPNGAAAKYDTIIIRDKKDVADGNEKELIYFNLK